MVPYFQTNPKGAQQTVKWPHSEPDVPTKLHKNPCQYLNCDLLFDCCSRFKNACIRRGFYPASQGFNHLETQFLVKSTVFLRSELPMFGHHYQARLRGCRVCLRKNFLCCVVSYGITKCRCTHDLGLNTLLTWCAKFCDNQVQYGTICCTAQ